MHSSPRKLVSSPACRKSRLTRGKDVLNSAAIALQAMATALEDDFLVAVDKILSTRGSVIVCGIGKAGLVGRKLAATLSSTGTRSHFLHPAEAMHGDLGCVGPNDLVVLLSNSGSTEEVVRLLPYLSRRSAGLIAITAGPNSPLARAADITLLVPPCREACLLGLAPTTSTTMMMALGDALALVVSESREFTSENFAELHPGGALGRKLAMVEEAMRPAADCRIASAELTIREMLIEVARPGRRTGAVMLVDSDGRLVGIFTDSDLAKLMERRQDADLDLPLHSRMTKSFSAIQIGAKLPDAIDVMVKRKISELPVVDQDDRPVGLIDITDVLEIEHTHNASQHPKFTAARVFDAPRSAGPRQFGSTSPQKPSSRASRIHPNLSSSLPPANDDDMGGDSDDWDAGSNSLRIFGADL